MGSTWEPIVLSTYGWPESRLLLFVLTESDIVRLPSRPRPRESVAIAPQRGGEFRSVDEAWAATVDPLQRHFPIGDQVLAVPEVDEPTPLRLKVAVELVTVAEGDLYFVFSETRARPPTCPSALKPCRADVGFLCLRQHWNECE